MVESCSRLNVNFEGYRCFQVMRFAAEEINNSSHLLPNVTLGYNVFDTCYVYNNIQPALNFMSRDYVIDPANSFTQYIPNVISVIGPDSNDAAETTANLFNLLLLPQINIFATSKKMSDLNLPSCFQTIPSSKIQQQAIRDILNHFHWTWIAVLGSMDKYGFEGVEQFLAFTSNTNICVAYKNFIPIKIQGKEAEWETSIYNIVSNITLTNVNVVLLFATDIFLLNFFTEVVEVDFPSKIWLATETWSLSKDIYNLPNLKKIGVVLGIALKYVNIPGFDEYLMNVFYQNRSSLGKSRLDESCNQNCDDCLNTSLSNFLGDFDNRVSFSIYTAVYAVAHALQKVLGCSKTYCDKKEVYPWQMTEALGQVNFTLLNNEISFNIYGDSPTGYDIVFWNWLGGTPFQTVGAYTGLGNLNINSDKINWQTENNTIPPSVCSSDCLPGQEKQETGQYRCCFTCVSCVAGTYLNNNGTCVNCGTDQWSTQRSTYCYDKIIHYLSWSDYMTIILFVTTLMGLLLTVIVIVTFIVHISSPVVKAAGGRMCFLMLVSLTVAYLSILSYLGPPSTLKCIMRNPIYSIALTNCFSYISIRSFQIVCIFKMASKLPATYDYWVKENGQYICLAILSGVQVLFSCLWIFNNPPKANTKDLSADEVLLDCSQFGSVYNILQYSYNALLSLLCFTFSYMGKELPKNYSEAKCITVAMLIYFVVCIAFFTAQLIDVGEYGIPINAGLALASLIGIKGGYFLPKCYIIFFKPKFNTSKHFQTTIQSYTKRGSGSTK
ncbi:taste receptor type 1 member 2-like isoform X2 [Hyla sarda]|uniref:taste receptor type 1 member 2-like isoform X2 n=1 Tax=Hyla sarda TaxID=327740 RepID=UPI0024C238E5|nr:taste receptor type 1 member 2-like isoform X2 [Hyla sarda]